MKVNKTFAAKVGSNEITKAAGPRRPLRKPPGKSTPSFSPAKPTRNRPGQPPRSTKPTNK